MKPEKSRSTPKNKIRCLLLTVVSVFLLAFPALVQAQINLADPSRGGTLVSYPRPNKITRTSLLIMRIGAGEPVWTTEAGSPPLDFVFSFQGICEASVSSVELQRVRQVRGLDQRSQVKDFKVEVSDTSPVDGFRTVGQFTLKDVSGPQKFDLRTPVNARFLKIRVLSNHGASSTVLGGGIQIIGSLLSKGSKECSESAEEDLVEAQTIRVSESSPMKPVDRTESESNNTIATANPIGVGESVGGKIERSGEIDLYSLRLKPEERGIINLSVESRPYLRTDLELLDRNGRVINRIGSGNVLGLEKSYSLELTEEQYYLKLFQPGMSVVLLVDNSGSMKGRENDLQRAVEQFVSERNEEDRVAIMNFAGGAENTAAVAANIKKMMEKLPKAIRDKMPKSMMQTPDLCENEGDCEPLGGGVGLLTDFTSDKQTLKAAAAKTGRAFGGTPLNMAMLKAFEKLAEESGNKAILLFSDGADTTSQLEYSDVWKQLAKDLGIRIYTVGLGNSLLAQQMNGITGRSFLRHLSIATDGRSFFTTEPAKLTDFYAQISREISEETRYRLEIGTPKGKGTLDLIAQGERLPAEVTSRRVELVFDASGSMHQRVGEKTRIEIAKEVVKDLIGKLPDETEVGMRVFGHRRKGDCSDIEMVAPFAQINKARLTSQVDAIDAIGITPLAASLRMVGQDMANFSGNTTLVVLTDGNEQCRGNPVAEVKKLQRQGIDINLHIIGFAVDDPSVAQLKEIAEAGDGQFHEASDASELVTALRTSLGARFEVHDATGNVVARGVTGATNLQLTEGYYRVVIKAEPEIVVKDVYIKNGETTTVIVTKEGSEINTEVRSPRARAR
ncbi:MAG: VWA domain-containing protein [Acidobacteria bacterium]|nr:MAG: VWA domain-containing protein [Acidobacteriota bacterium]REK01343.1 MAG: VWA domain-containing protein [Acidobacteriota bacterium]REK14299.1 MAG: VWA domain-containing protein [Acidobacteriota bacterium]REK45014.1 MAG: VWA domain-containing protein [Acidobacteriota bacterium]